MKNFLRQTALSLALIAGPSWGQSDYRIMLGSSETETRVAEVDPEAEAELMVSQVPA